MGVWEEYQLAAQRLDTARREAATLVAERSAVAKSAGKELASARKRLAAQRARLLDMATRLGVPAPSVTPDAAEVAAARTAFAATRVPNPAVAATTAVRSARITLDSIDVQLSTLDDPRSPARRGGAARFAWVYAVVALVACLIPVAMVEFGPDDPAPLRNTIFTLGSYCSAAILPLMGYGLAWVLVGSLNRRPNERHVQRGAALGALITIGCILIVYGLAIVAFHG
jgi:hypothetical protein